MRGEGRRFNLPRHAWLLVILVGDDHSELAVIIHDVDALGIYLLAPRIRLTTSRAFREAPVRRAVVQLPRGIPRSPDLGGRLAAPAESLTRHNHFRRFPPLALKPTVF
jgi:hypothetical protein